MFIHINLYSIPSQEKKKKLNIFYFKFDMNTSTSLMPVTPPCFACTTLTAQPPNKICSDLVVTFKYACTDDTCYTTNPCTTLKPDCKKNKLKKPCCIKHMEEEYRKRK